MTINLKNNRPETVAGAWQFGGGVTITAEGFILSDGIDVDFGTASGSMFGTTVSQKLAFYGKTPVAQRSGAAQAAVVTTAATQTTPYGFATQAQADNIVALVNELRASLVAVGLIKGSA